MPWFSKLGVPCRVMVPVAFALLAVMPARAQVGPSWESLVAEGQAAFAASQYEEARQKFDAALRIAETFPELDKRLATTLNNIAAVHYARGDFASAEPLFRQALTIREKTLGMNDVEVATSLNNLGAVLRKQGKHADSLPMLERALLIRENAFGPNHPNTMAIIDNLATVHTDMGAYEQAESMLQTSLSRRRESGVSDTRGEAQLLQRLSRVQQEQGKYGPAADSLSAALDRRRSDGGLSPAGLKVMEDKIADLRQSSGNEPAAAPALPPLPVSTPAGDPPPTAPAAPAETALRTAAGPATPPGSGTARPGGFYLQLASVKSRARASAEWNRIQSTHSQVLGRMQGDVVRADLGSRGIFYRIQAGPWPAVAQAEQACSSLKSQNQDCFVVKR